MKDKTHHDFILKISSGGMSHALIVAYLQECSSGGLLDKNKDDFWEGC